MSNREYVIKGWSGFHFLLVLILAIVAWLAACWPGRSVPDVGESPVQTPVIILPTATPEPTTDPTETPVPTTEPEPTITPAPIDTREPEPTIAPTPTETREPEPTPYEIIIVKDDWLSKIAQRHTGDPLDWPKIVYVHDKAAKEPANQHLRRNLYQNPDLIYEGEIIRLPQEWAPE